MKGRYVITEYDTSKAYQITDVKFNMGPNSTFEITSGGVVNQISFKD